ncbi:ATP-binding protein PhnP [Halalkaliarchaeum desulfuricum]|uniref:ATP-binding protein PhnP n=1 Tax=Halalkaliarchaeum desulfuricum TaxID=2055893 RepID=A0A343TG70_9EURY|nr:MBL fold metallo-hydrolase [Halalkaliarchaeum desulfuricum]AUX08092.1 ATP-binding protein PhnP [Halalkaliarchaeum desulfuricum]
MRVTLLGTGDTTGTPTVGCDCDTCSLARERGISRTRFSVHVENERTGESLLVDVSPDFRTQMLRQGVSLPDAAIVTHIHFDHLDGLGNVYRTIDDLAVYAANETDPETGESVAETVERRYDYLARRLEIHHETPGEPFRAAGFDVTLVPVSHPPLLCYGLRIEEPPVDGDGDPAVLAITGDTSYDIPQASREALSDADLLLADAIVPASSCVHHPIGGNHHDENGVPHTFGTKHMTREGALQLAEELNADRIRLVHVAHFYPADEAFEEPLAVDGERYDL